MTNKPTKTDLATTDLSAQLASLGLRDLPSQLDDFLARATNGRWTPLQVLQHLAEGETGERARRSLERRLRRCGLKNYKPMADFEWTWPKRIERETVERAFTLEFLARARNLILIGPNGLGKTMIAKNLCHAAVLAGHSVLFRSASELLEDLHRSQSPESRRRKLRIYANVELLCLDEVGYLSCDDKAADLLYEVVNRRYERKSLIVTTNRPFQQWNEVFPNATCIATLLDRLLHHADATVVEGDSYRYREAEIEKNARQRRPSKS